MKGSIEVICGSMFSGKSEELIRRVKRAQIARVKVQVFKPVIDNRFSAEDVVSHNRNTARACPITEPVEILEHLLGDTKLVAIDEVHFFSDDIVDICEGLADSGVRVVAAGLDTDFRGEPFMQVARLMARAEAVDKLRAICVVCGETASRTQRLVDGRPVRLDDPVILVGADEKYEARCRSCHQVLPLSETLLRQEALPLAY